MSGLIWRPLPYRPGTDLVKGTELAMAFVPGTRSRFAICETRGIDADRMPCLVYRLRDAETVSDAEVRAGVRPKVIGVYPEPEQAIAAAMNLAEICGS